MYFSTGTQLQAALDALPDSKVGQFTAFDSFYYAQEYMGAYSGTLTPIEHFVQIGAARGYQPSADFDPVYYADAFADLRGEGFDSADLIYHFMKFGLDEGRAPNSTLSTFDGTAYLAANPDVNDYVMANLSQFGGSATNGALAHYVKFGSFEDRTAPSTVPVIMLTAGAASVDEGADATFTLTGADPETEYVYQITGVSTGDITGATLGAVTTDVDGNATITVPTVADATTEGAETLTVSIIARGVSAEVTVNDTSLDFGLIDGLDALVAAQAAVTAQDEAIADFLVAAGDNDDIDAIGGAGNPVVAGDLTDALDATAQTLIITYGVVAGGGAAFNALTDAQQTTRIGTVTTALEADITAVEADLAAVVGDLETGVAALIATVNTNAEMLTTALDASDAAVESADNAALAAGAVTTGGFAETYAYNAGVITVTSADQNADGNELLDITEVNVDGTVELVAGVVLNATTGNYEFTLTDGGGANADDRDVEIEKSFLDALVTRVQAVYDADIAVTDAQDDLASAINAVYNAQDTDGYDDDADPTTANVDYAATFTELNDSNATTAVIYVAVDNSVTVDYDGDTTVGTLDTALTAVSIDALNTYGVELVNLDDAETALADFQEAVEAWEAVGVISDGYDALDEELVVLGDAETAALAAIEDAAPDGLGITLLEDPDTAFTADNDVYLYSEALDGDALSNFGVDGEDLFYFGEGYTLVEIDAIADNVGSASALEIFWMQDGADLMLYVETETFGGNSAGTTEIVSIELTGFLATDITGFAGGFLSAGTAV